MIVDDAPYVWFSYKASTVWAYKKNKKPKDTFKYGIGTEFWKFNTLMRVAD